MNNQKYHVTGFFSNISGEVCEIYEFYNVESYCFLKNDGAFTKKYFVLFYNYLISEDGTDNFSFISKEEISEEVYKCFLNEADEITARKMTDEDISNIID